MRTRGLRLMTMAALVLAALVLLRWGLSVAVAEPPDKTRQEQREEDIEPIWNVTARPGDFALASRPLTGVAARRSISDPGINSPLTLAENGRKVTVTGHFGCLRGEDYELTTTVTQWTTGALARGELQGRCTGRMEQFTAQAWAYDAGLFEAGAGQACAQLITRDRNHITDIFQWCRKEDVELTAAKAGY